MKHRVSKMASYSSSLLRVSCAVFVLLVWAVSGTNVLVRSPRGTSDSCTLPQNLSVTISREGGDDVRLDLLANQIITVPHHVVLMGGDYEGLTSQTVYRRIEEGTFSLDGFTMKLSPTNDDVVIGTDDVTARYVMEKIKETTSSGARDYIKTSRKNVMRDILSRYHSMSNVTARHPGRQARSTTDYYMDVLPVVDYYLYTRWLAKSGGDSTRAVTAIATYLTNVFTSMSLRYTTLDLHDNIAINIRMLTPHISTSAETSWYTEDHKVTLGDGFHFVNMDAQHTDFTSWISSNPQLPYKDHTMLFTGYEWYGVDINTSGVILGIAWTSSACNQEGYSSSVVQDRMGYQSESIAAHELGHSLGAGHDGVDNSCLATDEHIMTASSTSELASHNLLNPFHFSPCSSDEISTYVRAVEMTSYLDTCLLAARAPELPDVPPTPFDVHDLCPTLYGNQSSLCWNRNSFPLTPAYMCASLYCTLPGVVSCDHVIPPSGTCCSNGHYCVQGVCSPATSGECVMDDECPFPDDSTCADVINQDFTLCFEDTIYSYCCQYCKDRADYATPPTDPPQFYINGEPLVNTNTITKQLVVSMSLDEAFLARCAVDGGIPGVSSVSIDCGGRRPRITQDGTSCSINMTSSIDLLGADCQCSAQHLSERYNNTSSFTIDIRPTPPSTDPDVTINGDHVVNGDVISVEPNTTLNLECVVNGGYPSVESVTIECTGMAVVTEYGTSVRISYVADEHFPETECSCSAEHDTGRYILTTDFSVRLQEPDSDDSSDVGLIVGATIGAIAAVAATIGIVLFIKYKASKIHPMDPSP